jgi:large subunit ribosomal protein L4
MNKNKEINNSVSSEVRITCCSGDMFNIKDDVLLCAPEVISQAVQVHLQNRRQGTVKVKSRSDLISRSNKKPWRQKGTGKARAGTPRSPLWRGGGVCFGPQPRIRELSINKKMNRHAFFSIFLDLLDSQSVFCVDYDIASYDTKNGLLCLNSCGIAANKTIVIYDNIDDCTYYSFANLDGVALVSLDAISVYQLANANKIMYFKKNEEQFKRVVKQWFTQDV